MLTKNNSKNKIIDFIYENSSLTAKLNNLTNNNLVIDVISCSEDILTRANMMSIPKLAINYQLQMFLECTINNLVQIRNIKLCTDNHPLVVAQSIASIKQLKQAKFNLCALGNNSLGTLLYSNYELSRSPCVIFEFNHEQHGTVFARYSIFSITQLDILVIEIFLPTIWQKLGFI